MNLARTSKGMKLLHDLRNMIVPATLLPAKKPTADVEDESERRLTGKKGITDQRRQNFNRSNGPKSIHSGSLSHQERFETYSGTTAHQKSRLEKMEGLREEYDQNPNRSKLSTRLASMDRQRRKERSH